MPLTEQTRAAIRTYLLQQVTRYIRQNLARLPAGEAQPFHARLLPARFGAAVPEQLLLLSERSFSTRLGSWFQNIAGLVGSQFHQQAQNNYLVAGHIQPAAETHIGAIVAQMGAPPPTRRIPNRQLDIQQVLAVQSPGGIARQVFSDLYVLTADGRELYFEMKTVAPNKDTSMKMKTNILLISALRQGHNAETFAAMAYNPAGEERSYAEYPDSRYALQFLELGTDLIVGRQFWTLIGEERTYDELLQIAEEVGAETAPLL